MKPGWGRDKSNDRQRVVLLVNCPGITMFRTSKQFNAIANLVAIWTVDAVKGCSCYDNNEYNNNNNKRWFHSTCDNNNYKTKKKLSGECKI